MTDTTTTITPDERAEWRKRGERLRAERDWLAGEVADREISLEDIAFVAVGAGKTQLVRQDCQRRNAGAFASSVVVG